MNVYARIRKIENSAEFKRLFDTLMGAEYADKYEAVKEWKDFGVDGYCTDTKTVYQLYCPRYPERTKNQNYKRKITDDVKKLAQSIKERTWEKPIARWTFVTPDDLAAEIINHIHSIVNQELKIQESSTYTAITLAPLFRKHPNIQNDFPEITSGIFFDKIPRVQVNFVKNNHHPVLEIFNNGTEDVQDFDIEYIYKKEQPRKLNKQAFHQFNNPSTDYPHTCLNMQKGERQYFTGVHSYGDFKIIISAVGVESGKTFTGEFIIPVQE